MHVYIYMCYIHICVYICIKDIYVYICRKELQKAIYNGKLLQAEGIRIKEVTLGKKVVLLSSGYFPLGDGRFLSGRLLG